MNLGDRHIDSVSPIPEPERAESDSSFGRLECRGSQRLHRALLLILVLGGAVVAKQVGSSFVEQVLAQDNVVSQSIANSLGGVDRAQAPAATPTPEAASPEDLKRLAIIRQRMEEQLKSGQPSKFRHIDSMEWTVMMPDVAISSVEILDNKGIIRADFPDQLTGREDLTGGPGTGPTIKGWEWGREYTLPERPVLAVQKGESGEEVYWLMYPTSQGGWGDLKQPHIEAARISSYDSRRTPREITRAKLFDKDGQVVSVARLILKPLAQFTLRAKDVVRGVTSPAQQTKFGHNPNTGDGPFYP